MQPVLAASGVLVMLIKVFAEWLGGLLAPYEPIFKLVSYIFGPVVAAIAYYYNRKDRRELMEQATALGILKEEVRTAHAELDRSRREVESAQAELLRKETRVEDLETDLSNLTEGSQELWKLRPAKAFPEYFSWIRDPVGAKLLTIGNLKGGVGKTTLAANFAAYLSETRGRPVLLVDLDYQGSLSNMLMLAIERDEVESRVDWLFDETANLATVDRASIHLVPKLNRGWLVPANYTFAQMENRLLLRGLLRESDSVDVRYRLAHTLLSTEVRRRYAAIIFDMPPRMTLGSINALVASHFFIVPTILDSLSVEAVSQFLTNMKAIKTDLGLDLDLAGIVGMMTRQAKASEREERGLELARDSGHIWEESTDYVFKTTLPRKVDIANAAGEDVAYFGSDGDGPLKRFFDPLFEEICTAVWKGNGP
jgi:chromosome partitioning protein